MLRIKKQREFLALFVPCVEDGGTLPAPLLIFGQLAELGDDTLSRTSLGPQRFDEGEVDVLISVLGPFLLPKKHPCLHFKSGTDSASGK